jgi:hypothetical protein
MRLIQNRLSPGPRSFTRANEVVQNPGELISGPTRASAHRSDFLCLSRKCVSDIEEIVCILNRNGNPQ